MKSKTADPQALYDADFFEELRRGAHQSAEVIVPLILEWVQPGSVVDVGCGDGTWLSVFQAGGIDDILGLDGSYVLSETLQIPKERFVPKDLSQPVSLGRTFDLAVSLEVAEHLPAESAPGFVESLTSLSDVVLFSAAIPHQGGTHHVNEQWPNYWIDLFESRGYIPVDSLRRRLWNDAAVQPWYAQNSFLFVRGDRLTHYPLLQSAASQIPSFGLSVVHPTIYLQRCPESTPAAEHSEEEPSQVVQILDITLHPSSKIQRGEALTVHIKYQTQAPIETAIFTLSLTNEAGVILLDTETTVSLPDELLMTGSLQLQIDRLDLAEGDYFINPGIFSTDWTQTYDFQQNFGLLTVESDSPSKGLFDPPMRWSTSP